MTSSKLDRGLAVYWRDGVEPSLQERRLIEAIAAMLEAHSPAGGEWEVAGRAVFGYLKQEVPLFKGWLGTTDSFIRCGQWWKENSLTNADMIQFARWVRDGGLDWMDTKPRWSTFVRHGLEWIGDMKDDAPAEPSALSSLREEEDL